jgi:TatD DNase family protein|tara:strand:+ start:399 stop:1151 length:753 start_codon:yes stop_codon:yes gene_type:complete
MNWIFDAHIHLSDPEYESDIPLIMQSMHKQNIKACCVSMDSDTCKNTLKLSEQDKNILPFLGIHPEKAQDNPTSVYEMIKENKNRISGIGEIGLDRTYVKSDDEWEIQKQVFSKQLDFAEKFQKPVSIHSRKTLDDVFDILSSYKISNILLHWFDGNKKQLKKATDLGIYVSYGPLLVYANDKQALLANTQIDKILVETDGPVRFSRCFEHKTAQILFLPSVIFCASRILNITYEETVEILEQNSQKYLN